MVFLMSIFEEAPIPLEINRSLFEEEKSFVHVFSFSSDCISVGKNTKVLEAEKFGCEIFRRRTGGGAVYHRREVDVCFAFSFRFRGITIREIFSCVADILRRFILKEYSLSDEQLVIRDNGDIFFNNIKICGISSARKRDFFLFEGCLFPINTQYRTYDSILNFSDVCFYLFPEKAENFLKLSFSLFEFLTEKIPEEFYK